MLAFAFRKVFRALLTVMLLVTFTFFILRLTGDPATSMVGLDVPPEAREAFRVKWGLDRPLWTQYLIYLEQLAQGDFGRSFVGARPAWDVVAERLPKTLSLMGATTLVTLLIGIPLGVIAAWRSGGIVDRLAPGSTGSPSASRWPGSACPTSSWGSCSSCCSASG